MAYICFKQFSMKVDILAFAAHPDDVELSCAGTLIKHINQGKKVVVVDLTRGELGTRGSAELRDEEANASAVIMGLTARHNLDLGDGFFEINTNTLTAIIKMIRLYKPDVVLCNAKSDRHPDHGRGGDLVSRACFLSGLVKIKTEISANMQEPHRPKNVFRYIQDRWIEPDFVVDITNEFNEKLRAVKAFKSQFFDPDSEEPETPISSKEFMQYFEGRATNFGRIINAEYGEGFTVERALGIEDLTQIG